MQYWDDLITSQSWLKLQELNLSLKRERVLLSLKKKKAR